MKFSIKDFPSKCDQIRSFLHFLFKTSSHWLMNGNEIYLILKTNISGHYKEIHILQKDWSMNLNQLTRMVMYLFKNHFHTILRLVKRCAIITYKRGVYELSRKLLNARINNLTRKWENIRKVPKLPRMRVQRPTPSPPLPVNTSEKLSKNRN